ncbi:MAG TPA: hypothetical protein VJT73_13350 [Polyangiaceae bacterium]|nr:hypothetical protein [Polyangiaceae bacterium]
MTVELGRRLLASGAVAPAELRRALIRHLNTGVCLARALLELGQISERALEDELSQSVMPTLKTIVPLPAVIDELPKAFCQRLMSVPVRRDPRTGLVDIATVDPFDAHIADEFAHHVKSEVRLLRGSYAAIEQALSRIAQGEYSSTVILRKSTPPPARPPNARALPSDHPIPLVRKTARDPAVEVLGIRDIGSETAHSPVMNERGEPIISLRPTRSRLFTMPPDTSRGPFSPRAPVAPFADIESVLLAIDSAASRDEVTDCLIVGMSTVAYRVGVFAVKRGGFRGVACNAPLGDSSIFHMLEISSEAPTILGIAASSGSYLGPLPRTAAHDPLLQFMQETSSEVAAVLIRVGGRPAVVLFADDLGDTLVATRRAEELGKRASRAFSRLLKQSKGERRG